MYQPLRENFSSNSSKEIEDKHWKHQKSSNPVRTLCWKKSYLNVNLSLAAGEHRHEKLCECLCASWTQIKYAKNQSHSPLPNHSLLMMFGQYCGRRSSSRFYIIFLSQNHISNRCMNKWIRIRILCNFSNVRARLLVTTYWHLEMASWGRGGQLVGDVTRTVLLQFLQNRWNEEGGCTVCFETAPFSTEMAIFNLPLDQLQLNPCICPPFTEQSLISI